MSWSLVRLAALACGALLVLAQPPYQLWWLVLPLHAALFVLWTQAGTPRRAFWTGWLAGTTYFAFGLIWVAEAFLVDAATFGWMIPIAMPLLAGGLALFWGAAFWAASRVGPRSATTFALFWIVAEATRGFALTGFPWNFAGMAWLDTPLAQMAAHVGLTGLTALTILTGALLGGALIGPARARLTSGLCALALTALGWTAGSHRLAQPLPDAGERPVIAVVQPAIPQDLKWEPSLRGQHLDVLLSLTREAVAQGVDAVIWPEVATQFVIAELPELRRVLGDAIGPGATLLTGALRVEARGTAKQKVYNSLLAVDGSGAVTGHYDKRHLVPFGEYLPFDDLLTAMGLRTFVTVPGGLSAGDGVSGRMSLPGLPPFAPMICYEAIFSDEIALRGEEISWLVHVTNDAWFGQSAGPHQHFASARMRAIERGLPVVRSANTGISAIIGPRGNVVRKLRLNERGVVRDALPPSARGTLYHKHEESALFIILMVLLFIVSFKKILSTRNK